MPIVTIEPDALSHLILAALETSTTKNIDSEHAYVEVDGLLWGHPSLDDDSYTISVASTMLSSARRPDSVERSYKSEQLHQQFFSAFFPQLQLVGHFHSHPYPRMTTRQLLKEHCCFSEADLKMFRSSDFRVGLVITLTRINDDYLFADYPFSEENDYSIVNLCFSNVIIYIKVYIFKYTSKTKRLLKDEDVYLHLPSIFGIYSPIYVENSCDANIIVPRRGRPTEK